MTDPTFVILGLLVVASLVVAFGRPFRYYWRLAGMILLAALVAAGLWLVTAAAIILWGPA